MNFFLHKLMNHKRYLLIIFFTVLFISFLFGLYEYQFCSNEIKSFFQTLFVLKKEQTEYPIYLLQNTIILFFDTYLSSSYLGFIGILFVLFLKGIQISFSFIYIFSIIKFTPMLVLLLIGQLLIEIIFLLVLTIPNILLSLQTFVITFYVESNFDYKSIFNYKLNVIIALLLIFILSLLMKVYLINII